MTYFDKRAPTGQAFNRYVHYENVTVCAFPHYASTTGGCPNCITVRVEVVDAIELVTGTNCGFPAGS